MPIYEYRCTSCGAIIEVLQRIHDRPLKKCAKCSGALEKLISRTSFQLKGTGWYVTDYARKGKGDSEGSSTTSGRESSTTSEESSASKASSSKKPKSKSGSGD